VLNIKTILIVASSGGGGLIQAANAKEQEVRLKHPHIRILRRDLLKDWVAKWMGRFSIMMWNSAQKSGNVKTLKFLCISIAISDVWFAPYVFYRTLRTLFKEDVDHIIDTQPLCTGSIIKALRFFHWRTGKKICLEKVLVDLPTPKATHYFRSIRRLSKKDRGYLKITTIPPFLKKGETSQEFWLKHCRISEKQINYEPFYVRQSFFRYHKKPRLPQPFSIKAKIKNKEELRLIQNAVNRGPVQAHWFAEGVELILQPQDRVFTILLGSQPAYEGSLNYVRQFLDLARQMEHLGIVGHLFVLCSNHQPKEKSLLRSVSELVSEADAYLASFSVIPLSFQDDEVIAPLFYRSDCTCTRSGGQTLMELICVAPKNIWIHSESKKKNYKSEQELLEGIAGWESANALYMQRVYGAKIVTPHSFATHAREVFILEGDRLDLSSFSFEP